MRQWIMSTALLTMGVGCAKELPPPTEQPVSEAVEAPVTAPPDGQTEPLLDSPSSGNVEEHSGSGQATEATADETASVAAHDSASNGDASSAPPTAESQAPASSSSELKLEILDWDQTKAIAASHPGKVVVFDLWATYCPPCLKELPGLVALQEKYPDQVVCVSVCLDYEGDPDFPTTKIEPDIRKVLEKIKAHQVRNILLSTPTDDLFKVIEHQSMPVLYVYDQQGKRVGVFPDLKEPEEPTYARDIVPLVEQLLSESKP